jgi:Carbohydrate family 9 binding domain-like
MNTFVTLCLLFMTITAHAQDADPGVFKSIYAAQDVSLETNPRSEFWRGAVPVYAEADVRGNVVPNYRTEVRSRWTKDNLYLLYVCPYEELYLKPAPNTVAETNKLWNWDVAELFIGSNFGNIRRYKEFEVSPQGEWIDLDINLDLPNHESGWTWNSGFQVAARIDRKTKIWYAAMRIPFAALDEHPPAAGNIFRANLFRSQGPPERKKSIAWKAPMTDTFHTPERFGQLELVNAK